MNGPLNAQQQMILEAFNNQVYVSDRMDVQHTPLYDTITIAAAATITQNTSSVFTNVGPASGKTLGLCNLTQPRRLAAPEAFSIFGFRIRWSEDILRLDLQNILNSLCFEFYLGQKPYQRAPLWYFNVGGGITGFTTRTDESAYTNGQTGRESMHRLAIPIVIENQMEFFGQLTGNAYVMTAAAAGGTGITFQVLLDGLYARGVQ